MRYVSMPCVRFVSVQVINLVFVPGWNAGDAMRTIHDKLPNSSTMIPKFLHHLQSINPNVSRDSSLIALHGAVDPANRAKCSYSRSFTEIHPRPIGTMRDMRLPKCDEIIDSIFIVACRCRRRRRRRLSLSLFVVAKCSHNVIIVMYVFLHSERLIYQQIKTNHLYYFLHATRCV